MSNYLIPTVKTGRDYTNLVNIKIGITYTGTTYSSFGSSIHGTAHIRIYDYSFTREDQITEPPIKEFDEGFDLTYNSSTPEIHLVPLSGIEPSIKHTAVVDFSYTRDSSLVTQNVQYIYNFTKYAEPEFDIHCNNITTRVAKIIYGNDTEYSGMQYEEFSGTVKARIYNYFFDDEEQVTTPPVQTIEGMLSYRYSSIDDVWITLANPQKRIEQLTPNTIHTVIFEYSYRYCHEDFEYYYIFHFTTLSGEHITPSYFSWKSSNVLSQNGQTVGSVLSIGKNKYQNILVSENNDPVVVTINGEECNIPFWKKADLTWGGKFPETTTEETHAKLREIAVGIANGEYFVLTHDTEYSIRYTVNGESVDGIFRIYTQSGSSSAIYLYRLQVRDSIYSLYGNTVGTASSIGLTQEEYNAFYNSFYGKWMLFISGSGDICVGHVYYWNSATYNPEFEWFMFPNSEIHMDVTYPITPLISVPDMSDVSDVIPISNNIYQTIDIDWIPNCSIYGISRYRDGSLNIFRTESILHPISGTIKSQVDNPIVSCDISLELGDLDLLTLGLKIDLSFQFGPSEEFPMGVFYVDSIDYDILGKTVNVSARNAIGHILNDQTFDEDVTITGEPKDCAEYVLNRFGVEKFEVQEAETIEGAQFEWKANTTGLTALNDLFTMYSPTYQLNFMWTMTEAPDGTVVIGFDPFRFRYMPNTRYDFEKEEDVFSRKISTAIDGVYSHVRCEGTDQNGDPLTPVIIPVTTNTGWTVGSHKTYHAPALEGATQAQLQRYTSHYAEELANVGIKQTFSSPIRPQLLVGDLARIYSNNDIPREYERIGIISEITHTFGEKGFKTDFTLDSGGYVSYVTEEGTQYAITRSLSINGDVRKKRIIDFIKK